MISYGSEKKRNCVSKRHQTPCTSLTTNQAHASEVDGKRNSHVATRSISFADHEVSTRVVVPGHVELASSKVFEVYIRIIVGPVLDRVSVLARPNGLRSSSSHARDGRDSADNRGSEGEHDGKSDEEW
jgi:hypothetical protein